MSATKEVLTLEEAILLLAEIEKKEAAPEGRGHSSAADIYLDIIDKDTQGRLDTAKNGTEEQRRKLATEIAAKLPDRTISGYEVPEEPALKAPGNTPANSP